MPRFLRSTRFRVALTSFGASAVALGAVSIWFVAQVQDRLEDAAAQLAQARAAAVVQLLNTGTKPGDLHLSVRDSVYEVTDRQGTRLASCPSLRPESPDASLAADGNADPNAGYVKTIEPSSIDRTTDVSVGCASQLGDLDSHLRLHVIRETSDDSKYDVYAGAQVDEGGQQTIDSVRTALPFAVPGIALLIAVIAWFAVRRSLRPVEAIRREVAEIGAHDLGRRVPVRGSGDEIERLAGTMNEMLARLDAAVARQSRFTADASHELRTPVASIRTQLEVLLAHPDRLDWRYTCENALLDINRLQDLIADLVLLGKLDNDAPERLEPVPLSEVVEDCLAGRAGVTAEISGTSVVLGNRARLGRLVHNLVDNAERHARARVVVAVSPVDDHCVLTVTDDGPGIPAADRERVFDRFVRLDDGRARDDGGAGLGLAIVADIARAHGGTAEVADHEGGAQVVVRLPAVETARS